MKQAHTLAALVAAFILLGVGAGDRGIFQQRLVNGLQVIVVEDHAAPVVQVATWYRFGSLYETPGKTGLAHALEHMNFRGTSNVSAGGLTDIIAKLGAQMNARTDYDYTQFYFTVPADKLDVALYLQADRMQHALIAQSGWNIERGAVLSEIENDESSPFFNLLARVRAAAYPNSAHGRTPSGIIADVERAKASDIAKYYHEWYAPNNAALVIAGDVDHATVFAEAAKYFGAIPRKQLPENSPQAKEAHGSPQAVHGASVEAQFPFPFEVLDLAYAVPGDTEPGEPAVSTIATLIPNQRSPFYQALVQTNIAVNLDANSDTQLKGGLLHVFITLNPGHRADEAQAVFQHTLDTLMHQGISADLTQSAKAMTIAERTYSADSISGFGDLVGYTYGIVGERIQNEDARIAAITPESLTATLRTYLATPTVVGHLRPVEAAPHGSSQKNDASISDNFSNREPQGPITEPAWIRNAVSTPTGMRSKLQPTAFTLPNGVRVIVQEKHDRPTFTLRGTIEDSPAFEPPGEEGVAQLASTVANYESTNYPFATRRKTLDDLGAFVTTGSTFSAIGTSKHFTDILRIVADGEMHPTLADPWFSLEREQTANSLQSQNSISGVMIDKSYFRLLLTPADPALRFPSQTSVEGITRDEALTYVHQFWRPDLTAITIVGDVTPEEVRSAMLATFGAWQLPCAIPGDCTKPNTEQPAIPPSILSSDYIGTEANQVYIRLGLPAIGRTDPDYDAFSVLAELLGGDGYFESRLWQELRQKRGLVYNVGASLNADPDRGDFRIEFAAATDNVERTIAIVRSELTRLRTQPVSVGELTEAKRHLINGALLAEESSTGQADALLALANNHLPLEYYATLNERYARVQPADLERVARRYLNPSQLIEVFAGPPGPWSNHPL